MPSPQGRHFGMLSQSKFFAVFLVILIKAVRADFDEAVYIFMRIKAVRLKLNESNGDVRAVVGNSLEICQQIVEYKAVVERAYALLQAVDVVQLHLVAEVIYKLLKRLDAVSAFQIVCDKRIYRGVCDLAHGRRYVQSHLSCADICRRPRSARG